MKYAIRNRERLYLTLSGTTSKKIGESAKFDTFAAAAKFRATLAYDQGEIVEVKPRGFAAMDRAVVSAIAQKGGKAAHLAGTAHEFTNEEAQAAGRLGGKATARKRAYEGFHPGEQADIDRATNGSGQEVD